MEESLRSIRNVGDARLPPIPDGDFAEYVLDGQQRLTSVFAAIKGLNIARETSVDDFADIWIDLGASDDASVVVLDTDERDAHDLIRVVDLLNSLEHMCFLEDQIGKLDANIVAKIKEAGLEREWELVQSAPGLKETSAANVLAEIGSDMSQFPSVRHVVHGVESVRETIVARERTKAVTRPQAIRGCEPL